MYSICACSSYGRICASYFCNVGSAGTRLMAETLPLRKTCYFCFSFVRLPSHACGFFGFTRTFEDRGRRETTNRNSTKCQTTVRGVGFFHWCRIVGHDGQEEIGSFVVAIVFSLFSFLSASLLCLPVYICVKHENDVCVSDHAQENSAKPSSC